MYGKRVTTDGEMRPEAPPGARLDDARRSIGRDILAGESGGCRRSADIRRPRRRRAAAALCGGRSVGPAGRAHRHRRLRPPAPLPVLRHRPARPVRRGRRGRRRAVPAPAAASVVGRRLRGRPPGPRTSAEFAELEVDNPEFLLALTDARLVTGDAALFERLRASFDVPRTARARARRAARARSTPGTRVQRRRCISSSRTSRTRRAGCATSPRRARSPA